MVSVQRAASITNTRTFCDTSACDKSCWGRDHGWVPRHRPPSTLEPPQTFLSTCHCGNLNDPGGNTTRPEKQVYWGKVAHLDLLSKIELLLHLRPAGVEMGDEGNENLSSLDKGPETRALRVLRSYCNIWMLHNLVRWVRCQRVVKHVKTQRFACPEPLTFANQAICSLAAATALASVTPTPNLHPRGLVQERKTLV